LIQHAEIINAKANEKATGRKGIVRKFLDSFWHLAIERVGSAVVTDKKKRVIVVF
jgi:hypothetical protein